MEGVPGKIDSCLTVACLICRGTACARLVSYTAMFSPGTLVHAGRSVVLAFEAALVNEMHSTFDGLEVNVIQDVPPRYRKERALCLHQSRRSRVEFGASFGRVLVSSRDVHLSFWFMFSPRGGVRYFSFHSNVKFRFHPLIPPPPGRLRLPHPHMG